MTKGKKLLKCDHGCCLEDLKNAFEQHCEDLDEALDFSMGQYVGLVDFINAELLPYLEWKAHECGDDYAQDLLIDLNKRIEWV